MKKLTILLLLSMPLMDKQLSAFHEEETEVIEENGGGTFSKTTIGTVIPKSGVVPATSPKLHSGVTAPIAEEPEEEGSEETMGGGSNLELPLPYPPLTKRDMRPPINRGPVLTHTPPISLSPTYKHLEVPEPNRPITRRDARPEPNVPEESKVVEAGETMGGGLPGSSHSFKTTKKPHRVTRSGIYLGPGLVERPGSTTVHTLEGTAIPSSVTEE